MRTPIAHALAWPERIDAGVSPLDLADVAQLEFRRPEPERFPCLRLAYAALERGESATTALNAANEVAVSGFLEARIGFSDIARVIETTLEQVPVRAVDTLDVVTAVDLEARAAAEAAIERRGREWRMAR
jgi:1-deoxy-D-xylulose-5-phosphate reductoisomerase